MIYVTPSAGHIVMPWRQDLHTLIPHGRRMTHDGQDLLIIPNERDEARLARNLGVEVPSPIATRYDWDKHHPPAWDVQKITAALLVESSRAYVLSTMGTGKTRSVLFAYDYLRQRGQLRGPMLITAPLSTLTPVWEREIFGVLPSAKVSVIYGDRAKRLQRLAAPADIYVINHHGLPIMHAELAAKGFGLFVIDELAILRNRSTNLWKGANAVVQAPKMQFVWGLTGSPTPNAPTDAFAQMRLITPNTTVRTLAQFRDLTMTQVSAFRHLARPDANETIHRMMQPSVRYTREDVMELPETTYVDRDVPLDPKTAEAYKMLHTKMRLALATKSVTAVNEGVLQNKLLQVSCGFIYADDKTVYALPAKGRLDALEETIQETDRKFIVFAPFVHAIDGIMKHLQKAGYDVAAVHGATSRANRDKIFQGFQDGASPRGIVAHPGAMSHGLTLTAANTVIWYGPVQSNETYEQANARVTRPGQTAKTFIVHLVGTQVERATYRRLKQKQKMQGLLLDMFKQQALSF